MNIFESMICNMKALLTKTFQMTNTLNNFPGSTNVDCGTSRDKTKVRSKATCLEALV